MKLKLTKLNKDKTKEDFEVEIQSLGSKKIRTIRKMMFKLGRDKDGSLEKTDEFMDYLESLAPELIGISAEEYDKMDLEEDSLQKLLDIPMGKVMRQVDFSSASPKLGS